MKKIIQTRRNKQKGFTLLEILIAMTITVGIGVLITLFIGALAEYNQRFSRTLIIQRQAQQTLQRMVPEIRSAAQSNVGNYPIESAATSSFIFYSDLNSDFVFERVRYFLDPADNIFKRGVITPTGEPLVYVSSSEVIVPLIDKMNMGLEPIFRYYGSNATSTESDPLQSPVDVLEIKTVKIQLLFDEGTSSTPVIKGVENQATIRNLRFKENNEQI